jgi:hypothetical protein
VRKRRDGNGDNFVKSVMQEGSNDTTTSEVSVNDDWKNYVVLLGKEKVAVDDV